MENTKHPPVESTYRSFSLRAKLVLGFSALSAFVSFITARGIYTNMRGQISDTFRSQFITQSVFIFFIAVMC